MSVKSFSQNILQEKKKIRERTTSVKFKTEQTQDKGEGFKTTSVLPYETIKSQTEHFTTPQNSLDRCQPQN